MREIKEDCYKGTRILLGNKKRTLIHLLVENLILNGHEEIHMPIIQYQSTFTGKVGTENRHLMFNFVDKADRNICLAPEYTAVIQPLAQSTFKHEKNKKLFYIQECFRGEKPQAGRYRQFTQLGVEVLNPTEDHTFWVVKYAMTLIHLCLGYSTTINDFEVNLDVTRGLDYYTAGKGFEITCGKLGAQKQICGGGSYVGGIGFAIGIDRLLLLTEN